MYLKKSNFVIYLGLAAVVGFGVSFLFNSDKVQGDLLNGDISKASRYSNVKSDPAFAVIEEKLMNDKEYFNSTKASVELVKDRMSVLEDLTGRTFEACQNVPELQSVLVGVASLNAKAHNTTLALESMEEGLKQISNGKSAPFYEEASNSASAGFDKIEKQLSIGRAFVTAAYDYIEGKESNEEVQNIVNLIAEWSQYCGENAALNHNEEDLDYWKTKVGELSVSLADSGFDGADFGFDKNDFGFDKNDFGFDKNDSGLESYQN